MNRTAEPGGAAAGGVSGLPPASRAEPIWSLASRRSWMPPTSPSRRILQAHQAQGQFRGTTEAGKAGLATGHSGECSGRRHTPVRGEGTGHQSGGTLWRATWNCRPLNCGVPGRRQADVAKPGRLLVCEELLRLAAALTPYPETSCKLWRCII